MLRCVVIGVQAKSAGREDLAAFACRLPTVQAGFLGAYHFTRHFYSLIYTDIRAAIDDPAYGSGARAMHPWVGPRSNFLCQPPYIL